MLDADRDPKDPMTFADVEQLYTTHGPMVVRRCRALLGNEADAFDATQEVFLKVMERSDTLTLAAPASLLYRIATNLCLNRIRNQKSQPSLAHAEVLEAIAQWPSGAMGQVETLSSLRWLFGKQSDSTRLMATLYWLEGMTLEEVAGELGMSASGVRKRLKQMHQALAPKIAHLKEVDS